MGSYDAATGVLEAGKLSPYTALVFFALGIFLSNFIFNYIAMKWTVSGERVNGLDYFRKGNLRLHSVGILGGMIWNCGMSFSILASAAAGAALSYGLGQGATLISALWGVFIWKEFKGAPKGVNGVLTLMFLCFLIGLGILIASKIA